MIEYNTEVYIEGKKVSELTKFAKIGDKDFSSGICPSCFLKANFVKEFTATGWILKSKKCGC